MNIVSLFSGCGGLDLGFEKAGFNIVWANEFDKSISKTYIENHKDTVLDTRSIIEISSDDIPNCIGIIGGPPCQSWSAAGKRIGIKDPRGKLFFEFIRVLSEKRPLFFLAENVAGMISSKHKKALEKIKDSFSNAGYEISIDVLNASDYGVPQNRKRIFFVGYRKDLKIKFVFPSKSANKKTVREAVYDLKDTAIPALKQNYTNNGKCIVPNHEFWLGGYSYIFMSRNRVLSWDNSSFTIQANGRHVSLHPRAPKMVKVKKDVMRFVKGKKKLYRRLTVRECARIQTFPDNFVFHYENVGTGYKMIGNAVPVELSYQLARIIYHDLEKTVKQYKWEKEWKSRSMVSKQRDLVPA